MQHKRLLPNRRYWRVLLVFLSEALGTLLLFGLVKELLADRREETVPVFDIGLGSSHYARELIIYGVLRASLAFRGLLIESIFK